MKIKPVHPDNLIVAFVGNADRPSGPADVLDMRKVLTDAFRKGNNFATVTHHAVKIQIIPLHQIAWSFVHIKVGDNTLPASKADTDEVREEFLKAVNGDHLMVTHHAVQIELFPCEQKANSMVIIKVGSDDYPAGPKDIEEIGESAEEAAKDGNLWVTHHNVQMCLIPR